MPRTKKAAGRAFIAFLPIQLVWIGGILAHQLVDARQRATVGNARVDHVGVVVPNVETAITHYVRVMGFPAPPIRELKVPLPDGRHAEARLATFFLPNMHVEVFEPRGEAGGLYYEHLQAHGPSIQHVGFHVPEPGPVDELRAGLEQAGGRWTMSLKGNHYAYVNFAPTLGTTFEVLRGTPPTGTPLSPPTDGTLPPLATLRASHIGFAVTHAAAFAARFSEVFGTPAPRINEYKGSQYPPDSAWNRSAYLRLASWNQGGMGLEIIESVGGPTPWSEFTARHKGPAPQHLAFNVGDRLSETIRDLQAKGGKWTNGQEGGGYAYLDFTDTLGLIFEVTGTWRK